MYSVLKITREQFQFLLKTWKNQERDMPLLKWFKDLLMFKYNEWSDMYAYPRV
jgi:hypothetical protein